MNLIQMRYFQAVCQTGSFTGASRALSVSQPAVSIAIRALEEEFSLKLLHREGKTVRPTPEGAVFLRHCDDLLRHADSIHEGMQALANKKQLLRLGITPPLAQAALPLLYRSFTEKNPHIKLSVTEGPRQSLITQLEQGQLDVLFVNRSDRLEQLCRKSHVAQLSFAFCVGPDHPLAHRSSLTIPELAQYPLVCFDQDFRQIPFLQSIFREYGLSPNVAYQTGNLSTISGMIRYNGMAAFVYHCLEPHWQDLKFIQVTPDIPAEAALFWLPDSPCAEQIHTLSECAKSLSL